MADNYACQVITAFIIGLIAESLLFTGLFTGEWIVAGTGYNTRYGLFNVCPSNSDSYSYYCDHKNPPLREAAFWTLFTAGIINSLDNIFLFSYLCGLCCCGVRPWMVVMTKLHMTAATLGGILALISCTCFLIDVYAVHGIWGYTANYVTSGYYPYYSYSSSYSSGYVDAIKADAIPGYSFYLAIVGGILLWIGGCVGFSARKASKIGVGDNQGMGNSITVAPTGYNMMQNPGMFMTAGSSFAGQSMYGQLPPVPMTPGPSRMAMTPAPSHYYPNHQDRIILMCTSTQTSLSDLKEEE